MSQMRLQLHKVNTAANILKLYQLAGMKQCSTFEKTKLLKQVGGSFLWCWHRPLTIHKVQGLTMDQIVDMKNVAFNARQAYVALVE